MKTIIFLDAGSFDYTGVDLSGIRALGRCLTYHSTKPEQVESRIQKADVVIVNKVVLDKTHLENAKKLQLICVAATGYNNIDLNAAKKCDIAVCNTPYYSTRSVVEHTLMFLFALSHRLIEHHEACQKLKWSRSSTFNLTAFPFSNLNGKTLGIVGYGAIGKSVARLAKHCGMNILVAKIPGRKHDRKTKRTPLKTVLQQSDYVSLHCPLSPLTTRLVNRETLSLMKPTAFLLNLARGPVVDETAVALALLDNQIAGYAADVLSQEPPKKD
ncbi:MAG TPA: NAD(P)-dependent oxidoreductase, partial [bacterium]|nr:NAD(P)-dependent oxidoreductase [bacterium]